AARVFPEPVGAWISVCSPVAIAGQPSRCAGVGSAKAWSNHARVSGLKGASGSTASAYLPAVGLHRKAVRSGGSDPWSDMPQSDDCGEKVTLFSHWGQTVVFSARFETPLRPWPPDTNRGQT